MGVAHVIFFCLEPTLFKICHSQPKFCSFVNPCTGRTADSQGVVISTDEHAGASAKTAPFNNRKYLNAITMALDHPDLDEELRGESPLGGSPRYTATSDTPSGSSPRQQASPGDASAPDHMHHSLYDNIPWLVCRIACSYATKPLCYNRPFHRVR